MIWVLYSLITTISLAGLLEANRRFQMDGFRLNFWRASMVTVAMLPALYFVEWPAPSLFYGVAFAAGIAGMVGTVILNNLAARRSGRVASIYLPLKMLVAFILWLLVDPFTLQTMLNSPLKLFILIVCFSVLILSMLAVRRNDVSWEAFILVAPIGLMYGVIDVFIKYSFGSYGSLGEFVIYAFIMTATAAVLSAGILAIRPAPKGLRLCPPGMLKAAAVCGVLWLFSVISFLAAVVVSPNPGYVCAIQLLVPVILMGYHKVFGIKDEASPRAALAIVAATVVIVLVSLSQ